MKGLIILAGGVAVAASYFVLSALPAFSADTGTVNAQVTVASACITVTPTTTVDFGTHPFSTAAGLSFSHAGGIGFSNCSTQSENVFVRGTNATGTSGAWNLQTADPCTAAAAVNDYAIYFLRTDPSQTLFGLTTTDQGAIPPGGGTNTYAAGAGSTYTARLYMPCTGSNGAGETKSLSIIFTATL